MGFAGVKKIEERAALIAYLQDAGRHAGAVAAVVTDL